MRRRVFPHGDKYSCQVYTHVFTSKEWSLSHRKLSLSVLCAVAFTMLVLSPLLLCRNPHWTGFSCWRCCGMTFWCATPLALCSAGRCGGPFPPAAIFKSWTTPKACGSRCCLLAMLLSTTAVWRPFQHYWVGNTGWQGVAGMARGGVPLVVKSTTVRFPLLSQSWSGPKEWFTYSELWLYD